MLVIQDQSISASSRKKKKIRINTGSTAARTQSYFKQESNLPIASIWLVSLTTIQKFNDTKPP